MPTIYVPPSSSSDVVPLLRRAELRFAFLADITAVDYHPARAALRGRLPPGESRASAGYGDARSACA